MELTPYVSSLRAQLEAASASGDPDARRAAALLSAALEPSARLALMHALSDFAAEVTASLDDRVVEVTLDGLDLAVGVSPAAEPSGARPEAELERNGETSRVSLRLPSLLKSEADARAAEAGISLNTWLVEAVRDALRPGRDRRGGHRVRGWVKG